MYDLFEHLNNFRVTFECNESDLVKLMRSGLIKNANVEAINQHNSVVAIEDQRELPRAKRWEIYRAITDYFDDREFTPDDLSVHLETRYINSAPANISSFLHSISAMKLINVVSKIGKKNVYRLKEKVGHRRFTDIQKETRSETNGR